MNSKGLKGFTLIELLVSVAIVGILASIALPAYDGYISKSRVRTSQVDMISLGLSIESTYQRSLSYKAGNYADANAIRTVYERWRPIEKHFNYSLTATESSYIITSTGNEGKLKGCVMTMNDKGIRTNNCPGSSSEWN